MRDITKGVLLGYLNSVFILVAFKVSIVFGLIVFGFHLAILVANVVWDIQEERELSRVIDEAIKKGVFEEKNKRLSRGK